MAPRVVAFHAPELHGYGTSHERASLVDAATRLAALKGYAFAGEHSPGDDVAYVVPSRTLVGAEQARRCGIAGERDLFGGVVPFAFVATKSVVHPLAAPDAEAPSGWSPQVSAALGDAALPGYAVFCLRDALRAGTHLAARGPVRLKPAQGVGGRGQQVAADAHTLSALLHGIAPEGWSDGVVLETDLVEVTTYSVGQVRVAGLIASYYGTQRLTTDNAGQTVYGGSELTIIRGGYEALREYAAAPDLRRAIDQARRFEHAVAAAFPGVIASRRNYDVACGRDAHGRRRCGVLEQSWRIGGASAAEIAALEAFHADPDRSTVRASTIEVYGPCPAVPPDARVVFSGVDDRIGPITKYYRVEAP